MTDILIRASMPHDARWHYDDPSGVPDEPLALRVPEALRGGVERAAAGDGLSPAAWLATLVTRALSLSTPKAV